MNSNEILERINTLKQDIIIPKPDRVFYSGPDISEEAIYLGDNIQYHDIVDFWVSFLSWVFMDSIEFNDLTLYNDNDKTDLIHCKIEEITPKINAIIEKIETLNLFSKGTTLKACYDMSYEWCDKRYLFDYSDIFVVFNWYTGE